MSHKWLYFPFKDISNDPTMPGNQKRYEDKYGTGVTVLMKGARLMYVKEQDMLIIAGHGLPNSGKIGVTTEQGISFEVLGKTVWVKDPTEQTMTANDLAEEIADAKLPKNHKYIKLITCGGAGMVAVDDAKATIDTGKVTAVSVTAHSHGADCLASVLAKALGLKGYQSVMVKGYPGYVNAMGNKKTVAVEGTSDLSQSKKWYQEIIGGTELGLSYWKDGSVGMVRVPANLLNEYWFDKDGNLQKQHISLK
jgi:hypothetical protein